MVVISNSIGVVIGWWDISVNWGRPIGWGRGVGRGRGVSRGWDSVLGRGDSQKSRNSNKALKEIFK